MKHEHVINIHFQGFNCSCGTKQNVPNGKAAFVAGYQHARISPKSKINDNRSKKDK